MKCTKLGFESIRCCVISSNGSFVCGIQSDTMVKYNLNEERARNYDSKENIKHVPVVIGRHSRAYCCCLTSDNKYLYTGGAHG
eukprot:UN24145